MKVLLISGSPRRSGNTEKVLDSIAHSARGKPIKIKKIILNELKLRPCQNCGGCRKTGRCILRDDMVLVCQEIENADCIIVGSPIYFGNVSAQVKVMVDRMQSKWVYKYILRKKNKLQHQQGVFFAVGARHDEESFLCAGAVMKIFFKVLDIECKGQFFISGVDEKAGILKNNKFLKIIARKVTGMAGLA